MEQILPEKFIQDSAIAYLQNHYYKGCSINGKVFSKDQAKTKRGKFADGIVFFLQKQDKIFVASIEAKSATTLNNLTASLDKEKVLHDSVRLTIVTSVIMSAFYWFVLDVKPTHDPILHLTLVILWSIFVLSFYQLLEPLGLGRHKSIGALNQLKQYPGDECWLVIGKNSIKNQAHYRNLVRQCRRNKVGLLMIFPTGKGKVMVHPKYSTQSTVNRYLEKYSTKLRTKARKDIYELPTNQEQGKLTIAQRNYKFNTTIATIVLVISLGSLFFNIHKSQNDSPLILESLQEPNFDDNIEETKPTIYESKIEQGDYSEDSSQKDDLDYEKYCNPKKISGDKYLLKESLWAAETEAITRVNLLKTYGFKQADYLWLPCYENSIEQNLFCVFPYAIRSNWEKVENQLRRYTYKIKNTELISADVEIIRISSL